MCSCRPKRLIYFICCIHREEQTVSSNGIIHTLPLPSSVIIVRGSSNKSALTIIPKKIDITIVDTLNQRADFLTTSLRERELVMLLYYYYFLSSIAKYFRI